IAEDAHKERITGVAVSAQGRIALASQDKTVSLWSYTPDAAPAESAKPVESPVKPVAEPDTESASSTGRPLVTPLHFVAADVPELKIGIIGLDTSHSLAFTKAFNADPPREELKGFRVVAAYPYGSRDIESSTSRIPKYIEDIKGLDVDVVDSIDELLQRVDCVLLETNDGRPHLEQFKQVLAAKKPVFIDKPMAGSLADCIEIFDLAKAANVPVFSSSSLRFMTGAQSARNGEWGQVTGCDAFSPCSLEATHPDLFWYGIHGVEILFTVMGPEIKTVTRSSQAGTDVVLGIWQDGRIGTFRGVRSGKAGYGGTTFTDKGIHSLEGFQGYEPLVIEIGKFFRTGTPPVSAEETLAIYAFMEAADESKRRGGVPVEIEEVMAAARAAIANK
ncbi:MAG: Gfo/Idh/MocA family oxidoreductase, partial [Planctomycetaceae bacterium]|nr:Gfo/Idh/MocA family oxidoreductase [Planctomycetaceae bacterium]